MVRTEFLRAVEEWLQHALDNVLRGEVGTKRAPEAAVAAKWASVLKGVEGDRARRNGALVMEELTRAIVASPSGGEGGLDLLVSVARVVIERSPVALELLASSLDRIEREALASKLAAIVGWVVTGNEEDIDAVIAGDS